MKLPDIGDVMNKFEVLGIVGEGEPWARSNTPCPWLSQAPRMQLLSIPVSLQPERMCRSIIGWILPILTFDIFAVIDV